MEFQNRRIKEKITIHFREMGKIISKDLGPRIASEFSRVTIISLIAKGYL